MLRQPLTYIIGFGLLFLLIAFSHTHKLCWNTVNHWNCRFTPDYCITLPYLFFHAILNSVSPFESDCTKLVFSAALTLYSIVFVTLLLYFITLIYYLWLDEPEAAN